MNFRATTRAAEGLPRRAFTVEEVERMVEVGLIEEDERLELLGGELVPMSPKTTPNAPSVRPALAVIPRDAGAGVLIDGVQDGPSAG